MSRHWDFRKELSRSRPRRAKRQGNGWGFGRGEVRLMLVIGVTLGLVSQLEWLAPSGAVSIRATREVSTVTGPVRIIDGDTFDHRGQRIRIADIDTPELRSECAAEVRLAQAAKARLSTLLAEGPFELHRVDRDRDRYGRSLRVVVRDGRSIGDRLVEEGLARTWSGRREPWC